LDAIAIYFLSATSGGRVFGLDAQLVFDACMQLFNVCVLAALLSYLLYKPVQKFLKERADKIKSQINKAAEDMAAASDLKEQYTGNLKGIEKERQEILDAAQKLAQEKSRDVMQEAKKEADAIKERAHLDIVKEQEQIREALRLHIIETASKMAEKLVTSTIDKEVQDKIFNETLKELEETAWPN